MLNHKLNYAVHILPKYDMVDLDVSAILYASTNWLAKEGLMALNHFPTGLQLWRLLNKEADLKPQDLKMI